MSATLQNQEHPNEIIFQRNPLLAITATYNQEKEEYEYEISDPCCEKMRDFLSKSENILQYLKHVKDNCFLCFPLFKEFLHLNLNIYVSLHDPMYAFFHCGHTTIDINEDFTLDIKAIYDRLKIDSTIVSDNVQKVLLSRKK